MLEIINQKYMKFLFEISKGPKNISELAKKGDLTLSVASTLITRWARGNVVKKTKSEGKRGKEIIITLTDYGKNQVDLLKQINKNFNKNEKEMSDREAHAVSLVSESMNVKGGNNNAESN